MTPQKCPWPVPECPDDMCRHSVERGLCGKWVPDPSEDDELWGEEYPENEEVFPWPTTTS